MSPVNDHAAMIHSGYLLANPQQTWRRLLLSLFLGSALIKHSVPINHRARSIASFLTGLTLTMFAIAKTRGLLSRKVAVLPCFQIGIPMRTETFSPIKLVRADFATKSRRTVQAAYLKRREQKDQGPMLRHNEMIKHREVRLIGADGQQIGVVSLDEARAQARGAELDLVEVASGAKPPVCKLVNYSKYVYELQKAAQTKAKSAKPTKMKSMKFGIKIEPNDLDVKLRKILEFLQKQHAVRLVVSYIPRESWIAQEPKRREVMRTLLTRVVEAEAGFIERVIQVESFNMTATVYPLKAGHKKTPAELAGPLEQLDSPMQSKVCADRTSATPHDTPTPNPHQSRPPPEQRGSRRLVCIVPHFAPLLCSGTGSARRSQ